MYHYPVNCQTHIQIETIGDLPRLRQTLEALNLKPNYSRLAQELHCDRRTIKRHYEEGAPSGKRRKTSQVDSFEPLIRQLLQEDTPQKFYYKRVLWQYLKDNHGLEVCPSTFRHYLSQRPEFQAYFDRKRGLVRQNTTLRYETAPGEQAQIDWKEDVRFQTREGECLSLNVFVLVLGYSRFQIYHVSLVRNQAALLSFLAESFEQLGGVPQRLLSDNMRTIMDEARTAYQPGKANARFLSFAGDYGFEVQACVAGRPPTKGKVETQMKILDEIHAYQGQLSYGELVELVSRINQRVNLNVHQGTGKIPLTLFQEEKGLLRPLPRKAIRDQYRIPHPQVKVNASNMVTYRSNQYSVPVGYQGRHVSLQVVDQDLCIYHNTELLARHPVSQQKLNYLPAHYQENLRATMPYKEAEEIARFAADNLKKIGARYGYDSTHQ